MNFMPTADSRFLMYGHMDVYEIEPRFEYRNEYMPAADSRCFMYGNMHSV